MGKTRNCQFCAAVDGRTIVFTQAMDELAASMLWNDTAGIENVIRMRYPSAKKIEHARMCYV